jgi:hypothetical protein
MPTAIARATARMLGKAPVRIDVRTLALARYVDTTKLPPPPVLLDVTEHVERWPMYANDVIGDCTCAAAGHMIEAWTAESRGVATAVAERSVVRMFEHVKVVDPLTGEEGAVELDVLSYWRKRGLAGHRIGAFAKVAVHDHALVRAGAYLFGGLYIGLALPRTAQSQKVWDWTHSLSGPARPGSWGGHAVNVVRYSPAGLTCVTWGALQELTWEFWDRYCDEAYCIISNDFLENGRSPAGFDLATLKADLGLVTK